LFQKGDGVGSIAVVIAFGDDFSKIGYAVWEFDHGGAPVRKAQNGCFAYP
jgi:hypothetical protein